MALNPKFQAGLDGELLTRVECEKLKTQYFIFHGKRITLSRASQSAEFDHILIGKAGIFIIESKHWSGEIEFTNPGIVQRKLNDIKIYGKENDPISQLEHQKYVMMQVVNGIGMPNIPIHAILCFTHNDCVLKNHSPKYSSLKLKELAETILEQPTRDAINSFEITRIVNEIIDISDKSETYLGLNGNIADRQHPTADSEEHEINYSTDDFEKLNTFSEGLAPVMINGLWGFANNFLDVIIPPKYKSVMQFSEGRCAVRENELWGFINSSGEYVIKPLFKNVGLFLDGMAPVQFKNLWGYIDDQGKTVISYTYFSVSHFYKGFAEVKENDRRYDIVDKKGISITLHSHKEHEFNTKWKELDVHLTNYIPPDIELDWGNIPIHE